MSALDDLLREHRRKLIEREEATFREMLAVYSDLQRELRSQYNEIQKVITDAAASGVEISPAWAMRSRRIKQLLAQVQEQVVRFGGRVTGVVSREQEAAIRIAVSQTSEVIRVIVSFVTRLGEKLGIVRKPSAVTSAAPPIGSTLNVRAIESAVGMMGNGSPMTAYFEKTFAPAVAERLRAEVIRAVATGTDFNTIARRLMAAGDITRSRALTMARTEVNRVRRATTLQIYRENPDIEGWEWVASKSPRTCPACLAMDGRVFDLKDEFPQHINCRCTMIPVIKGMARPERETGAEWFDKQAYDIKEIILGKDAAAAYERGDITLNDMVGWATDKDFGKRIYTKKLADVLMGK